MNLNFTDAGSGKAVVLIHAFPLSNEMWAPQIEPLASAGYRLLLPDLPGFGGSPLSPAATSIDTMAEAVGLMLDRLQIERAIIGGLSLGGYVALGLYRQRPEKFAALVLCDTTARADDEEKRRARHEMVEKIEASGIAVLVDEMLPKLLSPASHPSLPRLLEARHLRRRLACIPASIVTPRRSP